MGRHSKYFTEEDKKQANRESCKKYYQKNKEKRLSNQKKYYKDNKEKEIEKVKKWRENNKEEYNLYMREYRKQYNKTLYGKASHILNSYKRHDKEANRGECTLTAQWIVDNIFSKPCHYCGETDWTKIGCDRIDNDKPHTQDNVVPCCYKCNIKKGKKTYEEFIKNHV